MGTTLTNGIYLPNEGEKNCYAGLKTNWEILDQKVADITALQQAVAGALHREIVESLPTTDIDPNTIYMILSGTSATENVYNEFMYVNNAWELIGTSATDLTNYYTKGDVDGLLVLKANASDLTSHTGDTTIHVTASDKTKWTNSANTVVLRLAKTALTPSSSTNAFSNLDDSTALKVGDKVMDTAGVLFEVTAIDTENSTFTIGTALIDLAQDSDVVHRSGNETVAGNKSFSETPYIYNSDSTGNTPNIVFKNSKYAVGDTTNTGEQRIIYSDKNNTWAGSISSNKNSAGTQYLAFTIYTTDNNNANISSTINYYLAKNGDRYFTSYEDNLINLGTAQKRWKSVYATNYYYGSNNVEFSDKFVTTDTAQTISGAKTFSSDVNIYNSDNTATTPYLFLKNSKTTKGSTSEIGAQILRFVDKNNNILCDVESIITSTGSCELRLRSNTLDSNNQNVQTGVTLISSINGSRRFCPTNDNKVSCGYSALKWSDVQTYKVNNLEPSSLSLPGDRSARIDISSYFTNTGTGNTNDYSVPANGYIFLNLLNAFAVICYSIDGTNNVNYAQSYFRPVDGQIYILFPVRKNDTFRTLWTANGGTITVTGAYFIPCQGNV